MKKQFERNGYDGIRGVYFIKSMLQTEADRLGLKIDTGEKKLKDAEMAELTAHVLNAADQAKKTYLDSLNG